MSIEKTREFYKNFDDLCDCAYCTNYIREIKKSYEDLTSYLEKIGVDIEKPFETMPGESENGQVEYFAVQYIVIGDKKDFLKTKLGEVVIDLAKSHPDPNLDDKYYVIEVGPIKLEWTIGEEIWTKYIKSFLKLKANM